MLIKAVVQNEEMNVTEEKNVGESESVPIMIEVRGMLASAARRMDIGERVSGQGVITQRIPEAALEEVQKMAGRMAAGLEPRKPPPTKKELVSMTKEGLVRLRRASAPHKVVPLVRQLLKESEGRITNRALTQAVHEKGYGVSTLVLTEIRKDMGFEGGVRGSLRDALAAEAIGPYETAQRKQRQYEEKRPKRSHTKKRGRRPTDRNHPLVQLVQSLAETHGITYLHWEAGQELVVRQSQEARYTV